MKPINGNRKRTGFEDKTLWDKLNLFGTLSIPLVVVLATILFGWWQVHLADLQHQSDQKLAQQQHDSDQQQALDQQRQATLVAYQDNMKDLLLNRGLFTSKSGDEVRVIALTKTLSAMRQLDGKRNRFLLQFLQDAHLIGNHSANIVSFQNADMSSIDLRGVDFSGANLSGARLDMTDLSTSNLGDTDLSGAYLYKTNLDNTILNNTNFSSAILTNAFLISSFPIGAKFNNADLSNANFSNANFSDANFSGAYLGQAFLNNSYLSEAFFSDTDLSGANLSGVYHFTQQQLNQVKSCKDATLPNGLICHQNQ
jgi:uncharacterized protein YjbI with pentapeptide repeats